MLIVFHVGREPILCIKLLMMHYECSAKPHRSPTVCRLCHVFTHSNAARSFYGSLHNQLWTPWGIGRESTQNCKHNTQITAFDNQVLNCVHSYLFGYVFIFQLMKVRSAQFKNSRLYQSVEHNPQTRINNAREWYAVLTLSEQAITVCCVKHTFFFLTQG